MEKLPQFGPNEIELRKDIEPTEKTETSEEISPEIDSEIDFTVGSALSVEIDEPMPEEGRRDSGFIEKHLNAARTLMATLAIAGAAETQAFDTREVRKDRVTQVEKNNELGLDLSGGDKELGIDLTVTDHKNTKENNRENEMVNREIEKSIARLEKKYPGMGETTRIVFEKVLSKYKNESVGTKLNIIQAVWVKMDSRLMEMTEKQRQHCIDKNASRFEALDKDTDRMWWESKREETWKDMSTAELTEEFNRFKRNEQQCAAESEKLTDARLKNKARAQKIHEHSSALKTAIAIFFRKDVSYEKAIKFLEEVVEPGHKLDLVGYGVSHIERNYDGKIIIDGLEAVRYKEANSKKNAGKLGLNSKKR